ncbi:MAG: hypothetical protein JSS66_14420 [Armatimonadetes bacterium]|nr:hypothetical protein [Armatimonadota bacterium]
MHEHDKEPVDTNLLEEMGYEQTDVNLKSVAWGTVWFMIISTVIMLVGMLLMWWVMPHQTFNVPSDKVAERRLKPEDPAPLLQSNATALQDMHDFQAKETDAVTTYGWTDRKSGHVRVPVEVAMKDVLQRGLPTRPNPVKYVEVQK